MPRGTGIYDNTEEPDEDDQRKPAGSSDADTNKPTPDVIEADSEDEPSG